MSAIATTTVQLRDCDQEQVFVFAVLYFTMSNVMYVSIVMILMDGCLLPA